jgi:hypothetical protein
MIVSKKALDNALDAANQLFLAFEDFDCRVQLAPKGVYFNRPDVDEREKPDEGYRVFNHWSSYRSTVVYVGTVAIGLTLYELSEQIEMRYLKGKYVPVSEIKSKAIDFDNYSWTTIKDQASGKFCLRAYSPYGGTSWQHEWKVDCSKDLKRLGHKIAKELALHAETISLLVEEAERKAEIERQRWEEERERWRREEEERRKEKAIKDSREELFEVIERWAEVKRINGFFQEVESLAQNLEPEQKSEINQRLEKARELIGELDAIECLTSWRAPDER